MDLFRREKLQRKALYRSLNDVQAVLIFSYQPGTNITIGVFDMTRIDEEVLDHHDALVYHEICLDNCTNQREWFMYQFDPKQLILTVPYDEFEELWPYQGEGISAVYTYALKAKEGREEELREEIRQIVGSNFL